MSVEAMTWVWKHSAADGNALLVLLAIADNAHDDGRDAFPGQKYLAKKCRLSERTIRRMVDELIALEELDVEEYAGQGSKSGAGRRTHRYTLTKFAALHDAEAAGVVGQAVRQPVAVAGQPDEVVGQSEQGCRTPVADEPSGTISPTARGSLSSRLFEGLKANNKAVRLHECAVVVDLARSANIADHLIDQAIGEAIARGAKQPRYVATMLGLDEAAA